MTPVERVLAAAGLEPVDRAPVLPVLLQQGARMLDIPLKSYFGEPIRLAEGQSRLIDRFNHDAVFAFPHIVQDTLPWGAGMDFHDGGPPSVNHMVITRYEDIGELITPDPCAHPYLRNTLRAAEELARRYKGDRLIVGAVIGPFSLPSMLMGMGKALALLIHHEEYRRNYFPILMEHMMAYTQRWAQAQLDAGCDLVVLAEGMASASLLTQATFLEYALPTIQQWMAGVKGLVGLEMVGDALPFMSHLRDLPCAALLVGSTDRLRDVRKILGHQKLIIGNINNLKLLHWDAERVEFEARRAIKEAGPGFALCNQGPEIPWHVPDENIEALVRAAHSTQLAIA
ncbi:MAG: uroporphyrinogen decarboxylase family protein [Candidatus Hydrogenedentes bacterium]|nr:uroporphyrinogen decarboxylase family protein [Candidatus Hydrogenedentota bacterium]